MVAKTVVLALGAAFFPALLACVAILISRPEPRRLILAFYLGGLLMSVAAGLAVTKVFEDGGEIAGSDSAARTATSRSSSAWSGCSSPGSLSRGAAAP